ELLSYFPVRVARVRPYILFFFECSGAHRDLHSFPTRRSSDLPPVLLPVGQCLADVIDNDLFGQICFTAVIIVDVGPGRAEAICRSEEHTSELQSRENLVCRLLREKKKDPPAAGATAGLAARPG